jgi:diguanylate cyclase (GGDEF)-like protein/PAS domain S-box-containing protein
VLRSADVWNGDSLDSTDLGEAVLKAQQDIGWVLPDQEAARTALRRYSKEFLLLITPRGGVVASSEVATLGYAVDGDGRHVGEYLHPDDLPKVFDVIERARAEAGIEETVRVRARRADGTWGLFEATVLDGMHDPDLRGAVIRVRDLGEAHPEREALTESDRFHSLAEALPLGILSADARGHVVFCNRAAEQIFGRQAAALMGRGWGLHIAEEDRDEVMRAAARVTSDFVPQEVTFRLADAVSIRFAHAKLVPLGTPVGTTGWIATVDDVTERRRVEFELAHIATHDPLTGLPNRLLLEDRLRQASARLRRDPNSASLTVVFLDLDRFKEVNDTYGHQAGDEVLIEVARRLRAVVRDIDTVSRFAGDEFVVVGEAAVESRSRQLIERVRGAFDDPVPIGDDMVPIGASVGSMTTADPDLGPQELLGVADRDMFREKRERSRR